MAKPIELGLILEGEDARMFEKYINNPSYSSEIKQRLIKAAKRAGIKMDHESG